MRYFFLLQLFALPITYIYLIGKKIKLNKLILFFLLCNLIRPTFGFDYETYLGVSEGIKVSGSIILDNFLHFIYFIVFPYRYLSIFNTLFTLIPFYFIPKETEKLKNFFLSISSIYLFFNISCNITKQSLCISILLGITILCRFIFYKKNKRY